MFQNIAMMFFKDPIVFGDLNHIYYLMLYTMCQISLDIHIILILKSTAPSMHLRYLNKHTEDEGDLNVQNNWWHRMLADFFHSSDNYDRKVEVERLFP